MMLLQYRMLIYSLDGRCLSSFSAYDLALGIKTVAWSPSSQFLAIGSYDQKVRDLLVRPTILMTLVSLRCDS
jgi:hypothetical protein